MAINIVIFNINNPAPPPVPQPPNPQPQGQGGNNPPPPPPPNPQPQEGPQLPNPNAAGVQAGNQQQANPNANANVAEEIEEEDPDADNVSHTSHTGTVNEVEQTAGGHPYVPCVARRTYFTVLVLFLLMIALGVSVILFSNSKHSPCFLLYGKPVHCRAANIVLKVFVGFHFVSATFFLNMVKTIRLLPWVATGNKWASLGFFLAALVFSNLPSFLYQHNFYGFWVSCAYHLYFWVIETLLAAETTTNLHSTFASINLTIACTIFLRSTKFKSPQLIAIVSVWFVAGVLHFYTLYHFKNHKTLLPFPDSTPLLTSTSISTWIGSRFKYIIKNCLWIISVPIYEIFVMLRCFPVPPRILHIVSVGDYRCFGPQQDPAPAPTEEETHATTEGETV